MKRDLSDYVAVFIVGGCAALLFKYIIDPKITSHITKAVDKQLEKMAK